MNIIYVTLRDIKLNLSDGVSKKILFQCQALKRNPQEDEVFWGGFFEDDYCIFDATNKVIKRIKSDRLVSHNLRCIKVYKSLPDVCQNLGIDCVYFRPYFFNRQTVCLFKKLKQNEIVSFIEIPTYPFWKEFWSRVVEHLLHLRLRSALRDTIFNIKHYIYSRRISKYISAIVTYSDIPDIFGCRTIGIENGYSFSQNINYEPINPIEECLNLAMVAKVRDNHGIDRVIRGIYEYKKKKESDVVVKLNIAGDGPHIKKIKSLVHKLQLEENVIFYGFLSGEELDLFYDQMHIGVSALGFHRYGVRYSSPLKSKEYFAKGLPVIGTFAEKGIIRGLCREFYYACTEDDSAVNIEDIIAFYRQLLDKSVKKSDIIIAAEKTFDWNDIMLPVYISMQNCINTINRV